jgi:2-polyprenyl-6-methoxyphenol hydroxylase-like FAD-dependent oxidoreductase
MNVGVGSVRLGERALVLGGSLAGLLSAGVLARHFDQVVVLERDNLRDRSPEARRGVPHARHSHGLLVGGSRSMERLLPGLTAELVARGAVHTDLVGRMRWWLGGAEQARFESDLVGLLASRPLIEDGVRQRIGALANVVLLGGQDITGLVASPDRRTILGARVAPGRDWTPDPAADLIQDGMVLADLVVDATGRASRAATWLRELGYPVVEELLVEAGMTYVTRHFRQQPGVLDDVDGVVVGSDPAGARSGVALRQEDGRWTVTVVGAFGERPPSDLAAFQDFAASLPTAGLAEVSRTCEPISEPLTYHYRASRWLRWDKVRSRPERFTVIGDAVCSFNPVYGQGMSSAAQQAEAFAQVLTAGLPGLPGRSAKAFAKVVSPPWAMATGADRRHPSQPVKPGPERLLDRYLDRLLRVAPHDRVVATAFTRVLNLLAPRILARVLWNRPDRALRPAVPSRGPAPAGAQIPGR